ncbi:MAG: HisA/HisF-related TIM barrel protein, partial [Crocinitomicaceae bacterium]|nr:HisA/HisF-related TIM barrel protein [Crocinitomicaceae bacterium]
MALEARIIPVLLLHKGGLYKTKQFKNPKYVGDPVNAVRIFNEKEVDELLILDIDCSAENKEPNYVLIEEIVSEAFMPIGYGGGI